MFQVIFTYDEEAKKWEAIVTGAKDATEARQGFSAVVMTCQRLKSGLLNHAKVEQVDDFYSITPAV